MNQLAHALAVPGNSCPFDSDFVMAMAGVPACASVAVSSDLAGLVI